MKIALLMDSILRPSIISDKVINKMNQFSEVAINETAHTYSDDIKKLLQNADIAVTSWGNESLTKEYLDLAPNLKLVVHAAGSVKPIISDELFARGIKVSSGARILSWGVSETALGFTIAAAKDFFKWNQKISAGDWIKDYSSITELFDITIGVVGCGFAGSHYIELLQAFDVNVLCYDPLKSEEEISRLGAAKVDLTELLAGSDIISLHAPSLDSTYHMINEDTLKIIKDDAILINTARGALIDESALYRHLLAGKLKYACLDVTDPEPPAKDNPLRTLTNCIITPHIAGQANNGKQRIGRHVLNEILNFTHNKPLSDEITKDMLSTIA